MLRGLRAAIRGLKRSQGGRLRRSVTVYLRGGTGRACNQQGNWERKRRCERLFGVRLRTDWPF